MNKLMNLENKLNQFGELLQNMYEEMRSGFSDAKMERLTLEQRLGNRINNLQEQIENVRQTQLEDSLAINDVLIRHDKQLSKIR